ncbi:hypothetical protein [Sulfurovum sp.]|nr:hypothetical protein [Sulfurovum sp.]
MIYEYLLGFFFGALVVHLPILILITFEKRQMQKYFNEKFKDFQK